MTEMTSEQAAIKIGQIMLNSAQLYAMIEIGGPNDWDYAGRYISRSTRNTSTA